MLGVVLRELRARRLVPRHAAGQRARGGARRGARRRRLLPPPGLDVREAFSSWRSPAESWGLAAVTGLSTARPAACRAVCRRCPNELALLAGIVVVYSPAHRPREGSGGGSARPAWSRWGSSGGPVADRAPDARRRPGGDGLHIRRARVGLVVGGLLLGGSARSPWSPRASWPASGARTAPASHPRVPLHRLGRGQQLAESVWQLVFGGGLSVKIIQSRVSGGRAATGQQLGVAARADRRPRPRRRLPVGLCVLRRSAPRAPPLQGALPRLWVFLVGRSLVGAVLFDATPAFLGFFARRCSCEGGTRRGCATSSDRPPCDRPAAPARPAHAAGRAPGRGDPLVVAPPAVPVVLAGRPPGRWAASAAALHRPALVACCRARRRRWGSSS